MKAGKGIFWLVCGFSFVFLLTFLSPTQTVAAVKAKFDVNKMADMSAFDPTNFPNPTGDTIKIAIVATFSGPAAAVGEGFWLNATWAAYDINKRGGLMVDGKKKLIQLFKADTMSRPDQAKKICEQMVLQEGVKFLWGADGSHIVKIMNQTADKYKVIAVNMISLAEELQDAKNFSRYAFMTWWQTSQVGRTFAYYYGQMRKKEKKFYIICQDYLFGHDMGENFKKALKEYDPTAQIVGEDYHKLFATDYAPYISKIKASGAEVIYTGDWDPDATNLLKQSRAMGLNIPFAHIYMGNPATLATLGVEATNGLVLGGPYGNPSPFKSKDYVKYWKMMMDAHKRFKAPYNGVQYSLGWDALAMEFNWLLSVIERAGSTDPEKIIKVWEGDSYQYVNGHVATMRSCDHNTIQDFYVFEYAPPDKQKISFTMPPYYWTDKSSYFGNIYRIPAEKALPWMDSNLDRCKGKKQSDIN